MQMNRKLLMLTHNHSWPYQCWRQLVIIDDCGHLTLALGVVFFRRLAFGTGPHHTALQNVIGFRDNKKTYGDHQVNWPWEALCVEEELLTTFFYT